MGRISSSLRFLWTAFPGKGAPDLSRSSSGAPTVADPDRWLAERVAEDRARGVWPQALPRIHRSVPGRAKLAVLFIHGFGASRGEGEHALDPLAEEWQANILYMRLPGHGIDADAHANARPVDYVERVADAVSAASALGERLVLMGSSTGGLLATWAAAAPLQPIHGLILVSPLFDYAARWVSVVAGHRLPFVLARILLGRNRDAGWPEGEDSPAQPGYADHWLIDQRLRAVVQLEALRRGILDDPDIPAQVSCPVLLLHYYADETRKDEVVSTAAMVQAFDAMNGGHPHPSSRRVPIANGDHVLTSAYVRADHAAVRAAIRAFLTEVVGPAPQ